jgi:mannose-1-phosphate guanylyltransferase/mannose-1-phosphate guanylyltransferase/mannose-6-phosphate isomerase
MHSPKPYREERPWGEELWLTRESGAPAMVKIISVKAGEALSLQYHHRRDEFWHVLSGDGMAEIGDNRIPLHPGTDCFVPREIKHRIEGGQTPLTFIELAFGEFDESDIVRLEDRYGRAVPPEGADPARQQNNK